MSNIFFGTPPNVKEDQLFPNRQALVKAGLHRSLQSGIDGNGNEGVAAIILSGGYEDDLDFGDEIVYTGHGGNDVVTKKQIEDQSWESHGNKGLVVSKLRDLPVRVIRGYKHHSVFAPSSGFRYGGLFKVVDAWEERGKSGFIICRFRLIKEDSLMERNFDRIMEGALVLLKSKDKEPKWFSIGVEAPKAQRLSADSNMALALKDKKVGDIIDFGIGFEVLEIKKYLVKI